MDTGLSRLQKRQKRQAELDATAVLAHPPTLRFLLRILEDSGVDRDPMTDDSHRTAHALGRRKTGLNIIAALQAVEPDAHLKLLQVAAKARSNDATSDIKEENDED